MSNTKLTLLVSGLIVIGLLTGVAVGSGDQPATVQTVTVARTVTHTDIVTRTETVTETHVKLKYKIRTKIKYRTVTEPAAVDSGSDSSGDSSSSGNCSGEYVGACVPDDVGDVNCSDLSETGFQSVGSDPYNLDADGDGIACES